MAKRDRHAELLEVLEEVLEELRRRPVGPPWEVTIRPVGPPYWRADPRPIVAPTMVLYGAGIPFDSTAISTNTTLTVH